MPPLPPGSDPEHVSTMLNFHKKCNPPPHAASYEHKKHSPEIKLNVDHPPAAGITQAYTPVPHNTWYSPDLWFYIQVPFGNCVILCQDFGWGWYPLFSINVILWI
jgi:hypothetical protein